MSTAPFSHTERTERAEARVGAGLCGKWRLDRLLGIGGMAAVFEATHRNGRRAAIKILHAELSGSLDIRERFLEEGYAANRVGPPGVVTILDEGVSEDGSIFLVMELLEGQTLEQFVSERRPLRFGEALGLAEMILSVLQRAHENGVIHRDIKPENVFLTRQGDVRLLDFGIAHMRDSRRTHPTEVGSAMGTPVFMPPEQARGRSEQIDARTDLWALGATLFWALSGRFVHEAATVNEELLLAMTARARSLSAVLPAAPQVLVDLVDRALSFDPDDRFPSASAMQRATRVALACLELDQELPTGVQERPGAAPESSGTAQHSLDAAPASAPEPSGARADESLERAATLPAADARGPAGPSERPVVAPLRVPLRRPTALIAVTLSAAAAVALAVVAPWSPRPAEPGASEYPSRTEAHATIPRLAGGASRIPSPPPPAPPPPSAAASASPANEPPPAPSEKAPRARSARGYARKGAAYAPTVRALPPSARSAKNDAPRAELLSSLPPPPSIGAATSPPRVRPLSVPATPPPLTRAKPVTTRDPLSRRK